VPPPERWLSFVSLGAQILMRDPDQGGEFNAANRKLIGDYASRASDYFRRQCEGLLNANSDDDYRLTPIEGRFAVAL